jgi:hypothetical protein
MSQVRSLCAPGGFRRRLRTLGSAPSLRRAVPRACASLLRYSANCGDIGPRDSQVLRRAALVGGRPSEYLSILPKTLHHWIMDGKFTAADGLRHLGGVTRIYLPALRARAADGTLMKRAVEVRTVPRRRRRRKAASVVFESVQLHDVKPVFEVNNGDN